VGVDAPQAAETVGGYTRAAEIGHLDLFGGPDHYIFDLSLAVDQHADLPARLMRKLRHLTRQLRRDYLLGGNPAGAEALDPP
jgi:hypothetical protein